MMPAARRIGVAGCLVVAVLAPIGLPAASARSFDSLPTTPQRITYRFIDLGALPPGTNVSSAAHDLNARGDVVGTSDADLGGEFHGFAWRRGTLRDLGTADPCPFCSSSALAVGNDRRVVGYGHVDATEPPHALLWTNGAIVDLGTGYGPGSASIAYDIDASESIVGSHARSQSAAVSAALWLDGDVIDLGTLGGHDPLPFGT